MLTTGKERKFEAIHLEGEIARTIYLLKTGGAMIGELTPEFYDAESRYQNLKDDPIPAMMAFQAIAGRYSEKNGVSKTEARKALLPSSSDQPEEKGDVTVIAPDEKEEADGIVDYANGEAEFRLLFGKDAKRESAIAESLLQLRQTIAGNVLSSRLAQTIEAEFAAEGAAELVLKAPTFFKVEKGDRFRFLGGAIAVVAEAAEPGAEKLIVQPLAKAIEHTGFLLDEQGRDKAGMEWKPEYTAMLTEAQLIQIAEFFDKERYQAPDGEPELMHLAEAADVFDEPGDAVGNSENSSSAETNSPPQTGTPSEPRSEATATAATNSTTPNTGS